METVVWSFVIPSGLYVTRTLGAVGQTALRQPSPQALALETMDVEGALASADCALRMCSPVSPTADHLRNLVSKARKSLSNMVARAEERRDRAGFMRLFRAPDFTDTNRLIGAEVETLKSRVHLYLLVANIFPEKFPKEDNGAFERSIVQEDGKQEQQEEQEEQEEEHLGNQLRYYGPEYSAPSLSSSSASSDVSQSSEASDVHATHNTWSNMVSSLPGLSSFIGTPPQPCPQPCPQPWTQPCPQPCPEKED